MLKKIAILTISILFCFCFFACEKSEIQPTDEKIEELVVRGKGSTFVEAALELYTEEWGEASGACSPSEDYPYYISQSGISSGLNENTISLNFNENPNYGGGDFIGLVDWDGTVSYVSMPNSSPFTINSNSSELIISIPNSITDWTAAISFTAYYDNPVTCNFSMSVSNNTISVFSLETQTDNCTSQGGNDNITMILPYAPGKN